MFSGRLAQFVEAEDLDKELKFNHDLIFIASVDDYTKLFKFLENNKDKEIILLCDNTTNVKKLLNDCPRREDCFPIIDYIYYDVGEHFSVSDIENLRMDDTVICKINNEAEYELTKQLIVKYTNCNFELHVEPTFRNKVVAELLSEKPIITSRTRVIL